MFKKLVFLSLLTIASLIYTGSAFSATTDTLFILQTTDVHGNIYPYNYFTDSPTDYGLAKAYTKIVEYRKHHKNVLLLDTGDLLQGTPLIYYFNKIEPGAFNPMILVMNYMGYNAFTVGNHDIEQGFEVYYRASRQAQFKWLSANGELPDGRTLFEPYTIIEINGIRVGILGLTTPGIPMWLDSTLYPGVQWKDMVKTAEYWAPILRDRVDVLVGSFHAGFNDDYGKEQTERLGLPNENASRLVAERVPYFDVIFAGHSHRPTAPHNARYQVKVKNNTLLLNAGSWARNLAVGEIILQKDRQNTYKIIKKDGWLESLKDVAPSTAILNLAKAYHEKTLTYTHTVITQLLDSLTSTRARWEDTPFMDLIHNAQLSVSGADISFASCFNDRMRLAPGPLKIKDVYQMYRYENYLYVVQMTGQQIKDFLEYSARYYEWQDGQIKTNPKIRGYNYDTAEGISYEIQVKNPVGKRITNLVFLRTGKPLKRDGVYKVAMNSYRATGGGGHMAAAGAKNAPVVWKSDTEIRNLLIEHLKSFKTLKPECNHNWKIVK